MALSIMRLARRLAARWHALLALAFAAVLAADLAWMHSLSFLDYRLVDISLRRHAGSVQPDPDILVVDIDDASLTAMQEIAGLWAWPREIHADLLAGLAEFGPRAIVFDIAFSERDMKRPKSDLRFSETVASMPGVYLSAVRLDAAQGRDGVAPGTLQNAFGLRAGVPVSMRQIAGTAAADREALQLQLPHAVDRAAWRLGLINSIEDADGVLRRYRLHTELGGMRLPSLPARVARDLGATLPAGTDFMMRWPAQLHRRLSFGELYRVLTERRSQLSQSDVQALDAMFRNRIVVIGSSAAGQFDHHLTPMKAGYPGVYILANALDNLKNGSMMRTVAFPWPLALGLALIGVMALALARRVNPLWAGIGLGVATLASVAAGDAAIGQGILLPVATPLAFTWMLFLVAVVIGFLRERRTREQAVALFGRFLNPGVVRQIVDQGETVESLSGRTCQVTVLFSDIRGFTTLSESRPPQQVVDLLNRYFERQVEVVFRHGGTLDKFIGDCIMAFWGAPIEDPEHARHAVEAALEMQQTLLEFKRELAAEGANVEDFDAGIGVHTGPAVIGFIGARRKLDYTAIGDTVNLASRVEGLTRGVARVLVTRDTMQACQASRDIVFESRGAQAVKGRVAEVELYEPIRTIT